MSAVCMKRFSMTDRQDVYKRQEPVVDGPGGDDIIGLLPPDILDIRPDGLAPSHIRSLHDLLNIFAGAHIIALVKQKLPVIGDDIDRFN